jgi:hypothetical protein
MAKYGIAIIGHGGIRAEGHNVMSSGMSLEATLQSSEIVIDITGIPWDDLCTLSIQGPLLNTDLPAGTISKVFGGLETFDWTPRADRDPRLGQAGPVDTVSVDVYLRMAHSFGATLVKGAWPLETTAA